MSDGTPAEPLSRPGLQFACDTPGCGCCARWQAAYAAEHRAALGLADREDRARAWAERLERDIPEGHLAGRQNGPWHYRGLLTGAEVA